MNKEALNQYLDGLRNSHQQELPFYLPRYFMSGEDWDRVASDQQYRRHGLFQDMYPGLDRLLGHKSTVVLGEPGAGKSYLAHAAILEATRRKPQPLVPVYVQLKYFKGDLDALIKAAVPTNEFLGDLLIENTAFTRIYVLDGLDEVPGELQEAGMEAIKKLRQTDPASHFFVTSRQAFYESRRSIFSSLFLEFHLLDFSADDMRTYVVHHGLDYPAFIGKARQVEFEEELSNPFTLSVAVQYFQETGTLGQLRSDIISHVIDRLIASRPAISSFRQRRALKMLGVAMEVYSRNTLTIEEARRLLLASMKIRAPEVDALLEQLRHSIIVRAGDTISFQMRSFGEYLAAEELQVRELRKILSLVLLTESGHPNDSWIHTVSYLAELNSDVRRYFLEAYPEWVLPVSPTALTPEENTQLIRTVLARLEEGKHYLIIHPLVKARQLARHVIREGLDAVRAMIDAEEPTRVANGLCVLAFSEDGTHLKKAETVAFDRSAHTLLRRSALFYIANHGEPTVIPEIIRCLDKEDPVYIAVLDTLAALMDEDMIPVVLPILLGTDVLISSAFHRFRELRSRRALTVTLQFLLDDPQLISHRRIHLYIEPIWKLLTPFWDQEVAQLLSQLLIEFAKSGVYEHDIEKREVIIVAIKQKDVDGEVAKRVLREVLATKRRFVHFADTIGAICTADTARWLIEQTTDTSVLAWLYFHSPGEVREVLEPHIGFDPDKRARQEEEYRRQEERQERERETTIQEQQQHFVSNKDFWKVLNVASQLEPRNWPELDAARLRWLAVQATKCLSDLDLKNNIKWEADNRFTIPRALPALLSLISHYRLKLTNDVPLVDSLLGWSAETHVAYYQTHGFSEAALREFETLLADQASPVGALWRFINFLRDSGYTSKATTAALNQIAHNAAIGEDIRLSALGELDRSGASNRMLEELAGSTEATISRLATDALIGRQHQPTIERQLAGLLSDDELLRNAENRDVIHSPIPWLRRIHLPEVWGRLVDLRKRVLKLELPKVADQVSETMAQIDIRRLAEVVREQIDLAPESWKDVQIVRVVEYEQAARLEEARKTTFDSVLAKLQLDTSMDLFKIWVEGPTDTPVYEHFVEQQRTPDVMNMKAHGIGGWDTVLSPAYDLGRLWDGCKDVIAIMDGDRGRKLQEENRPLSAEGKKLEQRLASVGIDLRVLMRYGIENYFSKEAMESVMRDAGKPSDLSKYFPLPEDKAVHRFVPQFDKKMNADVASRMTLRDLEGTDLGGIFKEIENRAKPQT